VVGTVSVLFSRLLVPIAVSNEIEAGGQRNLAVTQALAEYAIFESCTDYDRAVVEFLLQERAQRAEGKDQGEAEAVAQAAQRSANMVLVDDALGRTWADAMSIECHDTLWIFEQLRLNGYLTELRPHFAQLIRHRRRQPVAVMNDLLKKFDEPVITDEDFRLWGLAPL